MAEEIELKLLMQPEELPSLDRLLADLGAAEPQVRRLENTYFDTPDFHLHQAQAALRLRSSGQGWVQTLKTSGRVRGALSQRGEWESPLEQPDLCPELLPEGVIDLAWLPQLEPIFTTHFTRKTWLFETASGALIEVAADQGEVALPSGKKETFAELELELKAGDIEDLFALSEQLTQHLVLHPGLTSKAERGFRLLQSAGQQLGPGPQLGEQTDFETLNALSHHQLNQWIRCHENWAFNASEAELQLAQRALLRLQGLLVIQQRLCPAAPLHQARVDTKKLLQAFTPLIRGSHADRVLQQLPLTSVQATNWRYQRQGYADRRSQYRTLWKQAWIGQAGLGLVKSLLTCECVHQDFSTQAPQRLLDAACAHLRFPQQPMEAEVWLQRYPALVRLQLLLEQVEPKRLDDLQLAQRLIQGIEDLMGYQQLSALTDLPDELQQQLQSQRQALLFNLGRWAQALWTADQ